MSKIVTLRKAGNSRVLTVPTDLDANIGTKYEVQVLDNGNVVFTPVTHKNIFDDPEWKNYDYQKDLEENSELQPLNPVGKERFE